MGKRPLQWYFEPTIAPFGNVYAFGYENGTPVPNTDGTDMPHVVIIGRSLHLSCYFRLDLSPGSQQCGIWVAYVILCYGA
jgi:hypothetical protein